MQMELEPAEWYSVAIESLGLSDSFHSVQVEIKSS